MTAVVTLKILPRQTMTWDYFLTSTPKNSIGLDGVISGKEIVDQHGNKIIVPLGPAFDYETRHINFDHHEGVVREATMSTAKQVFYAIKGGLFTLFRENATARADAYVNDPDQDTSLAFFLLEHHTMIEGTNSNPSLNRMIELNDRLDITAGAFPMTLDDHLMRQRNWVYEPYTSLRKSGGVATANESTMRAVIEACNARLLNYLMGQSGELALDTNHEMLYDGEHFKIVNETGGNDARYHLFSQGMNAFVSIVASRPDGRKVCTIGKRSRYIQFDVIGMYDVFNHLEGLTRENGWNGSDIVGGSSRILGTGLDWQTIRDATIEHHQRLGYWKS